MRWWPHWKWPRAWPRPSDVIGLAVAAAIIFALIVWKFWG